MFLQRGFEFTPEAVRDWEARFAPLMADQLRIKRDMEAAKRFFKQAVEVVGHAPERVTTDGHDSYPRAIRETLGSEVIHRCNRSLNNRIEQDHRGIKQRYSPMRGFGNFTSAARFCRAFDARTPLLPSPPYDGENGLISTTTTAVLRATCWPASADGDGLLAQRVRSERRSTSSSQPLWSEF